MNLFLRLYIISLLCMTQNIQSQTCTGCGDSSSIDSSDSSCCTDSEICGNTVCKTVFLPFSQGENRAHDYAGIDYFKYVNNADETSWYATFNIAFEQNFKRDKLGAYFFPNGTNTLNVGIDKATDATSNADVSNFNVLLANTFVGSLTISPRIRNVIAEPTLYVGLDKWVEGSWFWTKIPITNTRWFLDCCETVSSQGLPFFTLDHLFSYTVELSAAPAFGKPDQIQQAFGGVLTVNDYGCPLQAGKIICCESNLTAIADIPMHLGYNIIRKDNGYLGIYFRAVFPTGKIKNRRSLFDATVGYKRWQFGIGTNIGVKLWEKNDSSLSLVADGYYTHIFNISQCRLFDLTNNGCFSRYLPLSEGVIVSTAPGGFLLNDTLYTGKITSVANAFNTCIKSGFDWNFDGVIFLQAQHKGWLADLGYEVKARSPEHLSLEAVNSHVCDPCMEDCGDCCTFPQTGPNDNKQYAIKTALPAVQPNSSISGSTFPVNVVLASTNNALINNFAPNLNAVIDEPTIFINTHNLEQLNYCSGRIPAALSHKLWGHIGYTLADRDRPISFGLGAEGEWGHSNKALSLWGIWGKCGIAYN